jgi:4-hydroxy-4-methyl-2-oxoglutarate aldolase
MIRAARLLAALLLAVTAFVAAGSAQPRPSREQALANITKPDVETRREAAAWLGEVGTMADAPVLLRTLADPDEVVRALAEHSVWQVWSRSGDAETDHLLQMGIEQMSRHDGAAAAQTFSAVIQRRPDFAEGWNKRATVYFLMGEYQKSLQDCDEVMKRNPSHFGALSGYGQIYLQLDQPERALQYFRQALRVNPNLRGLAEIIPQLERALMERRKGTICPRDRHPPTDTPRPTPKEKTVTLTTQQIDALKKITSPSVANAIETFKVRPREEGNVSSSIRALFPEMGPMVGYAVTALIRAERGPIEGHRASTFGWWDFVQSIPAPRVIVVHDLDDPQGQGAQWGEVQANIHRALGCVGVVTDGSVRDLDEVRALNFQFCAAHVSVSHANIHMVDFGLPVKVGGVWIKPGDLVHADQHGVVTVPPEIAAQIPEAIAKVEADERKIISVCQAPGFSADKLKALFGQIRPGTY